MTIERQIAAYGTQLVERQAPIETSEVAGRAVRELTASGGGTIVDTQERSVTVAKQPSPRRSWSGALVAAATFAVIAVIGAVVLIVTVTSDDGAEVVGTVPFTTDDALATTTAYVETFNTGDVEGTLAFFPADATIEILVADAPELIPPGEWASIIEYEVAQGTLLTPPTCTASDVVPGVVVEVVCDTSVFDGVAQLVGAPPNPMTMTLLVSAQGINSLLEEFSCCPVNIDSHLARWMLVQGFEDRDKVQFGTWTSREEARELGLLRAEYARQWADYLTAEGCAFDDNCF